MGRGWGYLPGEEHEEEGLGPTAGQGWATSQLLLLASAASAAKKM